MEQPNLEYINELSGGDLDFKAKIISIIKLELPTEIKEYHHNFNKNDFKATAEVVHKLKHKISILGFEKKYYIADQFEINLKEQSIQLKDEFDELLKIMQKYVNKL